MSGVEGRRGTSHRIALAPIGAGLAVMVAPLYFTFVFASHGLSKIFAAPPPLWFGRQFLANLALLQ